ncbi:heterokaryon incompatibility [Clohesyomyces aquaticus]|uniref:Heterokaryon incompatibility n=1 Tax=Clohesyomyces aquaticus TaxID=1231657 RepID=A0A1Y1Y712_9PLEO|nr:heterokaryon incompatibility [Clohesyomyces aquaticus]
MASVGCELIALSYVWNASESAPSPGATILQDIPATIEDAITVTRQLGYSYLWVDQYCIDQTNPQEKDTQIGQMGQIYGSAALTIIAAAGIDPTHGLPGASARLPLFKPQELRVGSLSLIQCNVSASFALLNSRWATRAWT